MSVFTWSLVLSLLIVAVCHMDTVQGKSRSKNRRPLRNSLVEVRYVEMSESEADAYYKEQKAATDTASPRSSGDHFSGFRGKRSAATGYSEKAEKRRHKRASKKSEATAKSSTSIVGEGVGEGALDKILRAYQNPGLSGDILYIARREMKLQVEIDQTLFNTHRFVRSELQMYKQKCKKLPKVAKGQTSLPDARVTIHQTVTEHKIMGETKVLSSVPIAIEDFGWNSYDTTEAFTSWLTDIKTNRGLQVWVESSEKGKLAARIARKTRFVKPNDRKHDMRPVLMVYYTREKKYYY